MTPSFQELVHWPEAGWKEIYDMDHTSKEIYTKHVKTPTSDNLKNLMNVKLLDMASSSIVENDPIKIIRGKNKCS